MEVILSWDEITDFYLKNLENKFSEYEWEIKIGQYGQQKLLRILKEPCTDDSHSSGYWDGDGYDDMGNPIRGEYHYDYKFNCPECMKQIEKEVNDPHRSL